MKSTKEEVVGAIQAAQTQEGIEAVLISCERVMMRLLSARKE